MNSLFCNSKQEFKEKMILKIKNSEESLISEDMKKQLEEIEKERLEHCIESLKDIKRILVDKFKVDFIRANKNGSYISKYYFENIPHDSDFIIIFGGKIVSLRSNRTDFSLVSIAQNFGGGGHPQSAGFPINDEFKELLRKQGIDV